MSKKEHKNSTSVLQNANHFGIALLVFIVLAGTILWLTGNLYFGPRSPAEAGSALNGGHQHNDENSSQVTVWSERFEIFLEHAPITVNTPTEFVTHVSDLETLEPRKNGTVTFILQRGTEAPIKHIEQKPARDGIYIPELTFPRPGQWNISLVIPHGDKDHVITLSPFEVYASHEEADNAPVADKIDGISFLKEQQWKIASKTEPARSRQIADVQSLAVPESAIIDEGTDRVTFVQLAGETFEERSLTLGAQADGFVQVLSGLSAGERVVTKGALAIAEAEHEHENEQVVHLTEDDIERFQIEVGTTGPGEVDVHVRLPGQIVINNDRVAHIVPNAVGVVRQVLKNVGDTVKAGEIIAWLESSELGKAKVDYLTKWGEVGCCSMDLTRAQLISDSTMNMLEILKSSPSLEAIPQIDGEALDANHTLLISSYAELVLAKSAYQREKSLFEKKISSYKDYLTTENKFKKADAKYAATRDSIAFEVKRNLLEAKRAQQVRQIDLKGAERNLYVLGLNAEDVNEIRLFAQGQSSGGGEEEDCDDPNCPECAAERAAQEGQPVVVKASTQDEKLAWYPLRAPFDATVIEKHITLGEKLSDESSTFTIADLSTVWVDLSVYQKDLSLVRKGQHVEVTAGPGLPKIEGTISYVGPVIGEQTRTALARVVLDNRSGALRPGTFVNADVLVDKVTAKVAVPKDVIQDLDDRKVVFVQTEHSFEPRIVTIGRSNDACVEITSGLSVGEKIVIKNSFRLKAELEKVAGGAHAGHGHVH
jgi:multidrug efflux pump subunit AcrA (membrane-fusion protein)